MAYTPTEFVDVPEDEEPPPGAPDLDAPELNKIGLGIKAAHDDLASHVVAVDPHGDRAYANGLASALDARVGTLEATPPGGVTDHGALTGLADDDHTQYHTDTRGDVRYYTKAQVDAAIAASGGGAVDSVNGQTGIVALDADDLADGSSKVMMTAVERTKLTGIATGATANATDAQLRDRSTHTGTQAAGTITGLAAIATSGSASDLGSGTVPTARLGSGTAAPTTVLHGDQTYKDPTLVAPPVHAMGNVSGAITLDAASTSGSVKTLTLTGATTATLTGSTTGREVSMTLYVKQDATGGRALTLTGAKWASGAAATLSTGANAIDRIVLTNPGDGSGWFADLIGKAYA